MCGDSDQRSGREAGEEWIRWGLHVGEEWSRRWASGGDVWVIGMCVSTIFNVHVVFWDCFRCWCEHDALSEWLLKCHEIEKVGLKLCG